MKTKKQLLVLLSILTLFAACSFNAGAVTLKNRSRTVLDHVVYEYRAASGDVDEHYAVVNYFDSETAALKNTAKKITIRSKVNKIPVTEIDVSTYDFDWDDYYSTHYASKKVQKIVLPQSITRISPYAFSDFSGLRAVTLPQSVTDIPDGAFKNCSSLHDLKLQAPLTSIGKDAFRNCGALRSFDFPDTLQYVGEYAFMQSGLRKISLPSLSAYAPDFSRRGYDYGAFSNCFNLSKVTFRDTDGATSLIVADAMFADCHNLQTLVLPRKTAGVLLESWALQDCWNLRTVKNVTTLKTINHQAFDGCSSLETFTLPAGVEFVHPYAFSSCLRLKTFCINSTDPDLLKNSLAKFAYRGLQDSSFIDFLRNDCMIYVKTVEMKRMVEDALHSRVAVQVKVNTPQNLTAAAGGDGLTLTWTKIKKADGYGVFCFDAETNAYVQVGSTITALSCVLPNAAPGARYVVRACRIIDGDVSWSADSPAVTA